MTPHCHMTPHTHIMRIPCFVVITNYEYHGPQHPDPEMTIFALKVKHIPKSVPFKINKIKERRLLQDRKFTQKEHNLRKIYIRNKT